MLCYIIFCLGVSSESGKSFVSQSPIVLKFETEVFSGVVLFLVNFGFVLQSIHYRRLSNCVLIIESIHQHS
jgi:hypothetical protein